MTVISAKLSTTGVTGTAERGGKREYQATYVVVSDSKTDHALTIQEHFRNQINLPHPDKATVYAVGGEYDLTALCKKLSCKRVEASVGTWVVTADFGDVQNTEKGEDEDGNPTDDPIEFALEITHRFTKTRRPVLEADYIEGFIGDADATIRARGNPHAVVNSAFIPYDPPLERDHSNTIVTITGNFDGLFDGEAARRYMHAVNDRRWRIAHGDYFFAADAYQSKIQNITPDRMRTNGLSYWRVTFEIETDIFGWRQTILDRGTNRRQCAGDADGRGGIIANRDPGQAHSATIVDDIGYAVTEPVLLDGNGQPIDVCRQDPVWVTWAIYPELNYRDIPLLGEVIV